MGSANDLHFCVRLNSKDVKNDANPSTGKGRNTARKSSMAKLNMHNASLTGHRN